jgi:hypothetical protein
MKAALLLTDDEVVALAAVVGRPWPTGLATVDGTAELLQEAGFRGVRSLAVRGMLVGDPAGESGFVIHPDVETVVSGFLNASSHVGAYIAPIADTDRLAGASITAATTGTDWWLVTTTAQGVHGIRSATRLEVLDAIADLADKTHDGSLLNGAEDPSAFACMIRWDRPDDEYQLVVEGNRRSDGTPWNRAPFVESFAATFG